MAIVTHTSSLSAVLVLAVEDILEGDWSGAGVDRREERVGHRATATPYQIA